MDENSQEIRFAKALGVADATIYWTVIKIETLLDIARDELSHYATYRLQEMLRVLKENQSEIDELENGKVAIG